MGIFAFPSRTHMIRAHDQILVPAGVLAAGARACKEMLSSNGGKFFTKMTSPDPSQITPTYLVIAAPAYFFYQRGAAMTS